MEFKKAYEALKQGYKIKREHYKLIYMLLLGTLLS